MKRITYLIFLISTAALCQNTIGLPEITNHSKKTYGAGGQNKQIVQGKNGILYFANNEGVLSYDGIAWKVYPLPNKSIVRSIAFGPDGLLYAGGQDEFGYFAPDKRGLLIYYSLKHLIPQEERSFTDVWKICFFQDRAFFQTTNKIFQISDNHCTVYKSQQWRFMTLYDNKLIAQDQNRGLLSYQNGLWAAFLKKSALPVDYFATNLTSIGTDSALLSTVKNGVYIIHNDTATQLKSKALNEIATRFISSAIRVNDDHIALTTNLGGCFIIDKKGNLVQSFSRKEDLQNNNVLDIFLDREKNIWLGLDNGIAFIAFNNAIKHIYPDAQNDGSGYSSIIHDNLLYLGTSNGLYKIPLQNAKDLSYIKGFFEPVKNTSGQVWNLSAVNGTLLMGHHDGAYVIKNDAAISVDNSSGFWNFLPYDNVLPSALMVAGTYEGVNFYTIKDGNIVNKNTPARFESSRFIVMDNNKIWIAHPYKGIFQVQLNALGKPAVKQYTKTKGVASINGNYIFKIKNKIILANEMGVYEYNALKDVFEPSNYYNKIFGKKGIRYLKEDPSGNIWFIFDKIIGVIESQNGKTQIIYLPELNNKFVSGFEHILPVDKSNVFIGGEKGFYHVNFELYKKNKYPIAVQIRTVKASGKNDSLLFGGYFKNVNGSGTDLHAEKIKVNHALNSFQFEFASPIFAQQTNIEYSFFLQGFDNKWADFSKKTGKEYTNLPAGDYTFQVKARNNLGNESQISEFSFTVLPPWYQTIPAFLIYVALFAAVIFLLIRYQKRKFKNQQLRYEEEQKKIQYLHQLELEKTEKEIVKLKNEKLEAEIAHQNTELATSAMHLVQKGELLTNLKGELKRLTKDVEDEKTAQNFKKLIKVLGEDDRIDKDWEHFAHHFDKVQSDFLMVLKNSYPNLSPNELKLSAYLRMNLSTKEIAQLMNISVRGVEISRYRLRKKLQIPPKADLFNFLMSVQLPAERLKKSF